VKAPRRARATGGIGHSNLGVTRTHLGRPREALGPLREAQSTEGKLARKLLAPGEAAALAKVRELRARCRGDRAD